MKKLIFALLVMASTSVFAGAIYQIKFSTPGTDCYANGTTVCDGECYALVWVKNGASFEGFLADGSVKNPVTSKIVLVKAAAENGHCKTCTCQFSEKYVNGLGLGGYIVCLLDTRGPSGAPLATFYKNDDGKTVPVAINGYRVIADAPVTTEIVASTTETMKTVSFKQGTQVNTTAALPVAETELKPVIKSAEMRDGKFVVTVENAVPYMKYDLKKGDAPGAVNTANAAAEVKPGLTETIELETSATESSGFIKVTAERHQ